ncbi:amidohydrolase [Phenylobacterium sp.]|jgi:predicted amidohydrolase YtcJ|uniref:amidohydrolase n=1 Tax=Phenylobacterium sp. TaxID=1871053 RepID=UPI0037839AD6
MKRVAIGVSALALLAGSAAQAAEQASLVLRGGRILTFDDGERVASAVAVQANRIVAVGSDADIGPWVGPGTQVVELNGRTVTPGLIDSHSHLLSLATADRFRVPIALPPLKSIDEIMTALKGHEAKVGRGKWVIGQGTFNQKMPTRAQLDAAFPDTPVLLIWSLHDFLINHRAALALGLSAATPDPGGMGRIERTADGEPMILRDTDVQLPEETLDYETSKAALRDVMARYFLRYGVTTIADLSGSAAIRQYQDLRDEGRLPVRVNVSYIARGPEADAVMSTGLRTGFGDDWLRLGSIKVFADGVWGTTAAVYKPFWKGSGTTWVPDNRGGLNLEPAELQSIVKRAHAGGWQVWVHANGDRAQDEVLTAVEAAQAATPRPDARHRIEHFANFLVQDPARTSRRLARMKADGVIPSTTVAFLWRLTDVNVKEPDMKFFPMKTLLDLGFHPPGAPDMTGSQRENSNPLFSIERAVARTTKYGQVVQPEEAVSVMDGLRMFTRWSAEANFLEQDRGSIAVGKLADFAVFRADPTKADPKTLRELPVDLTIVDGKVAYDAKAAR